MKKITTSIFALILALTLTAQSTKQVLHTITREGTPFGGYILEYVYNDLGKEEEKVEWDWNTNLLRWELERKTERAYDALGQIIDYQEADWDDITLRWIPFNRYRYFCVSDDYVPDSKRYQWDEVAQEWEYVRHWYRLYNEHGDISENYYLHQIYPVNSFWENYTYDENNNLIQMIRHSRDQNDQKWELSQKHEYRYNSDNQRIEEEHFEINSSQIWEPTIEIVYSFAPAGQEDSRTVYRMENGEWQPTDRTISEYNTSGKTTSNIRQEWQEDFQNWASIEAYEYTYDALGNPDSEIYTFWDPTYLTFSLSRKYEYEYDQNNNLIVSNFFVAYAPEQFFSHTRDRYTYNYDYEYKDLVTSYTDHDHKNMLTEWTRERWDSYLGEWEFDFKNTYEYSPAEIRTLPTLDANYVCVNVQPNPATEYIMFRVVGASTSVRVRLFDVNGKALSEDILGEGNILSVSHLQRGVYFYQLMYNGIRRGGKFMVK